MAPTPQGYASDLTDAIISEPVEDLPLDGDKIVISGISGLFPKSYNVKEFSDILYNKENPVTCESRWEYAHPEVSKYLGCIPDLERFDAQFFAVHYRLANAMDPLSRKMLEQTYQAIFDAGVSPSYLSGKKVAVFIGSSFADFEQNIIQLNNAGKGFYVMGSSKTMFANRISYWLNISGPSLFIDELDCGSTTALEQAYLAIKSGVCDAAIVGGAHATLSPQTSIHYTRLNQGIAEDGKTKSFSQDADGFVLSDAIGVMLLQKVKDANRAYAEIVHVKNEYISVLNNEFGPMFDYSRNPHCTAEFIKKFYKEAKVSPNAVEYIEGYGTGVPDADKSELQAIEEVYCEDRDDPLLVGSVTSNVGLTFAASGMTALTKVLLGYHTGKIAANLHCSAPRQDIAALRDRRLRVVTDHQRIQRTYTAINGMCLGGVNSHVLLHGHYKPKDLSRYQCSIPRLVNVSGRHEAAVNVMLEDIKSQPLDAEQLALLHKFHTMNVSGHLARGYAILDSDENHQTVALSEKVKYFDAATPPLWFVYSGMGSQWAGMGAQLLRIPIFAAAIERCDKVLKPRGLDIVHIITTSDETIFDNILHSFVGIAAIQIGLTDILLELGLKPDGIIGHSVGELGCAYADGCLSAEEMILCAYSRGLVSLQTKLIRGSMAAVGLGYEKIITMCPPEIDVACHNGPESSTISGPADVMKKFVDQLTIQGIFAKEVPCSNIAYHSRYIADAGPNLLKYLKEIVHSPKLRSERWISSSVPQEQWFTDSAKYCSAEYHTNNLLSPVLFEETSKLIPSGAVLVEVAPHGLLQAILKRSLPADCRNIPLTNRRHKDGAQYLLQAIGELHLQGYTPEIQVLYPKVTFPVSTGTPMLSHLVRWMHNEEWVIQVEYKSEKRKQTAACSFVTSIHDDEFSYLQGHVVRENLCYPFAAALVAVWDTAAMYTGATKRQVSAKFSDLHLYTQPILHDKRPLRLEVEMHRGTGQFEVTNHSTRVMSGIILTNIDDDLRHLKQPYDKEINKELDSQTIYQLLQDRDYMYSGEFRSIEAASACFSEAALAWTGNWVTFIDGLLQLNALRQSHDGVSLPKHIRKLNIDVGIQKNATYHQNLNGKNVIKAIVNDVLDLTKCGGILINNIQYRNLPAVQNIQRLELAFSSTEGGVSKDATCGMPSLKVPVTLQCAKICDLKSLRWVEIPPPEQSDCTVKVHYAGLNISDVMRATGAASCGDNTYGMDYSGVTKSGERVMGLVRGGAASSVVKAQPQLLWPVPAHWSLEDAATVPLAYAHAFYCLIIKAKLQPGMSVLVHGGAGTLGQAAIAVALAHQCQVFPTVSNIRKKQLLLKLHPQLKEEHIGNSRDNSFLTQIMSATEGNGVHIILSCVKGELKHVSLNCLAPYGKLIDTAQIQTRESYNLGMSFMFKNRSYILNDFSSIFTMENHKEFEALHKMISAGITSGYVKPLTRVTYAASEATRAFKLLASSQHLGRVLLRIHDSEYQSLPRIICNPDECQLLVCDRGSLGVQLAERLISRGAKKLFLHCPNPSPYQLYKIEGWRNQSVKVVLSSEDLSNNTNMLNMINNASNLGKIEGIYAVITESKNATIMLNNLDTASRSAYPKLKHFTVINTVKGVGQNTCLSRVKCGYAGKCVDLSSLCEGDESSMLSTRSREALDVMERALVNMSPVLIVRPARVPTLGLLEQLATLSDLKIPQHVSFDTELQDLGMSQEKILNASAFLDLTHNISLGDDRIPLLTLERLQELEKLTTDIKQSNKKGLSTFFTKVELDELLASTDSVVVPTSYKDIDSSDTEMNIDERYLYILPGMESLHSRFSSLCERLKLPAVVLQPGMDQPNETVRESAEKYAKVLINKFKIKDNFYLLGYESGASEVLEVAAILEESGISGTVFIVGVMPNELSLTIDDELKQYDSEEQLQNAILHHMNTLIMGDTDTSLKIASTQTWTEKVNAYVLNHLNRRLMNAQYARAVLHSAYARITRARKYVPTERSLRSRLVLLRATTTHAGSSLQVLQRYSHQPIVMHQLRSSLSFITQDPECTAIINRYLDEEIKRTFEMKNMCVFYDL